MAGAAIQAAKMFAPKGTAAKKASVVTEIGIGLTLGLIAGGAWKVRKIFLCFFFFSSAADDEQKAAPSIGDDVLFFLLLLLLCFHSTLTFFSPQLSPVLTPYQSSYHAAQSWHWSERRKIEEYYKSLNNESTK